MLLVFFFGIVGKIYRYSRKKRNFLAKQTNVKNRRNLGGKSGKMCYNVCVEIAPHNIVH